MGKPAIYNIVSFLDDEYVQGYNGSVHVGSYLYTKSKGEGVCRNF